MTYSESTATDKMIISSVITEKLIHTTAAQRRTYTGFPLYSENQIQVLSRITCTIFKDHQTNTKRHYYKQDCTSMVQICTGNSTKSEP